MNLGTRKVKRPDIRTDDVRARVKLSFHNSIDIEFVNKNNKNEVFNRVRLMLLGNHYSHAKQESQAA